MKHLLIDYSKLKVGQKLWDIRYEEVTILSLNNSEKYPILVSIEGKKSSSFTKEGRAFELDKNPSLFLSSIFEQNSEFPKIMEVSQNGRQWEKRVVIAKNNRTIISWNEVDSIEELTGNEFPIFWNHAREVQKPKELELTLEQIAYKFGVPVETIKIKK